MVASTSKPTCYSVGLNILSPVRVLTILCISSGISLLIDSHCSGTIPSCLLVSPSPLFFFMEIIHDMQTDFPFFLTLLILPFSPVFSWFQCIPYSIYPRQNSLKDHHDSPNSLGIFQKQFDSQNSIKFLFLRLPRLCPLANLVFLSAFKFFQ